MNIVTSGGMVFDQIRVIPNRNPFGSGQSVIDNLSWNTVPAPTSTAVLALGGITAMRRRR